MKNKQYIKSAILFMILIFIFPIVFMILKKDDYSETENRPLKNFPEISAQNIIDKSYMNGIEAYLSDHFPFRINWVKAKMTAERLSGKSAINNIYICSDRMLEKLPEPDYREINLSVNAVNKFSDTYDTEVYALIASDIKNAIQRGKKISEDNQGKEANKTPKENRYYDNPDTQMHVLLQFLFAKVGINIDALG